MAGESLNPNSLFLAIVSLASGNPINRINNFTLKGPVNVPTEMEEFVGLIPQYHLGLEAYNFFIIGVNPRKPQEVYREVLDLKIPTRIQEMRLLEDRKLSALIEFTLSFKGLPSIWLAFGNTSRGRERFAGLYCPHGMLPKAALELLHDGVRDRQAKLN